jgi:predicted ATPase
MLAYLAVTLKYLGYIDQARARLNDALSEARGLKHAQTLAVVLSCATWMESITRSPEMQRHVEELIALSTKQGFSLHLGWATAFRGSSLSELGQVQEGLVLITQGLAEVRATGTTANTLRAFMWFADAYARLEKPVEGLNCLGEAARIMTATDERCDEAELCRLRGDLLTAMDDRSAAEQCYHQALAVAERQSAKPFKLRAATSLARLWRDQGKRTEAHDLLAPVYNWFTEGFDTPVLKEAKALLEQLAAIRKVGVGPILLTRRNGAPNGPWWVILRPERHSGTASGSPQLWTGRSNLSGATCQSEEPEPARAP